MEPALIAGRYRELRAVGRGGMGTVWLCRDEVLNREVAAKRIEGLAEERSGESARPLREARLSAAVSHPNAVALYDIVESEDSTWLIMEYVPSMTLAELLREEGRLPVSRVARIGTQVASALAAAHALGIVHRDIKPGNLLIGDGDQAKVSDFGIARGEYDEQLTQTGFVTGTPAYFAPELARGADPSPASDVWALGATLYEAVEGDPPYGRDPNPLALLARIAATPPPRPARAGPLSSTLASMLRSRPEDRASMAEVVASLRAVGQPTPDASTRVHPSPAGTVPLAFPAEVAASEPEPYPGQGRPRRQRRLPSPALLAVGLALVLVLLIAGAILWTTVRSPHDASASGPDDSARTPPSSADHSTGQSPTAPTHSTTTSAPPPSIHTSPWHRKPPPHHGPPPPVGSDPAAFVSSYYRAMPEDVKDGWKLLAPSLRKMGRTSYENFWGSIDSIEVTDVRAANATSVDYRITYHFGDGRVVQEQKEIALARHAHSYWITADSTQSSTRLRP
jgi:serine/threonine protein kinase